MTKQVRPDIAPGIYSDIPNEAYHAGPGISKSGLWKIETASPAHFKHGKRKETHAFDFGEACHLAILEPHAFETKVMRGPLDRRGNKWKDAVEFCAAEGRLLLTEPDFINALTIRDAVHADPWLNTIITGGTPVIENSGYWIDEATGELCRCRPDLYRPDLGVILDLKSAADASPDGFARAAANFGYHAQEAFYTDGWNAAMCAAGWENRVQAFVFLTFEKEAPFAKSVYELPPSAVVEGRARMRRALDTYHACRQANDWPGYDEGGVQSLALKRWAYTDPEALAMFQMEQGEE